MINVAVKPGWAGGKSQTRYFEQWLASAGYAVTDILHADAVIAHSTACYDLKTKSPATYYLIIDPPYWPKKPIWRRFLDKSKYEANLPKPKLDWKQKIKEYLQLLINVVSKPQYASLALKSNDTLNFLNDLKEKTVIVVRNDQDYISSPDIEVALAAYPNAKLVKLPGGHNDYYYNAQPYIALLPKNI